MDIFALYLGFVVLFADCYLVRVCLGGKFSAKDLGAYYLGYDV